MLALVLLTIVPLIWFGMIVAISFIETPLKFRAPGMTHALGVGIGRLVFKALNLVEAALAVVFLGAMTQRQDLVPVGAGVLMFLCILALLLQMAVLRPAMAKRTKALAATALQKPGSTPVKGKTGTLTHLAYIGAEAFKVVALPIIGIQILLTVAA
ncbi:hypothetical protein [Arthrobacter psychrolactophilus]